ncbi:MAG: tetratricopeptide repeat protein [Planctomycetota bacterium]
MLAGGLLLAGMATMVLTSPRPDVEGMVERAEEHIEARQHAEALAMLNDRVRPLLDEPYVTADTRQRFHAGRARAIALGVQALDAQGASNHERIVDEYTKAESAGLALPAKDQRQLIRSLTRLGRLSEAGDRLDVLPDEAAEARVQLRRALIEAAMETPGLDEFADTQLLRLGEDPALGVDDRAWIVARQSERRLAAGFTEEAIARLLRVMPRVSAASDPVRGELFLLLGTAYAQSDALAEARKQLDRAHDLVEPGSDLYARVLLERGLVLGEVGDTAEAREHFETIVGSYATSTSFLPAALALAEVVSLVSEQDPTSASVDDAIEAYARAGQEAVFADANGEFIGMLTTSILRRFEEQFIRSEYDAAGQYVQIAEDIHGLASAPAAVLEAQGRVGRALADQLVADASRAAGRDLDLGEMDSATRVQAQRWYMQAGDYFRRHADAIAGESDDEAYADSVWNAAEMFDAGGDTAEAIASFIEFASSLSDDRRLPEARFRLARAYQAAGQYGLAAQQYESLIEIAQDPERGTGVGPFAVLSYVPLAETYLEDADPANDERASDLLDAVLRGEAGGVESETFADALVAMGMVRYYRGDYPRAIETLEEAVARAQAPARLLRLRYLLADAYRLEAEAIVRTLGEGAVAPTVARSLNATRESHLLRAIELFAQVRDSGADLPEARRSATEDVYLRNAHFYLGDCAFDLGEYSDAIRYYGFAKDAYADEPASLVALVQIFNSYLELGDIERARTASERARRFYEQLPDTVWDDPTLPVGREDWERWLDSTYELASMRAASLSE